MRVRKDRCYCMESSTERVNRNEVYNVWAQENFKREGTREVERAQSFRSNTSPHKTS